MFFAVRISYFAVAQRRPGCTLTAVVVSWSVLNRVREQSVFPVRNDLCDVLFPRAVGRRVTWRGGRVVYRGGLENRWAARSRGFESLPLRQPSKCVIGTALIA